MVKNGLELKGVKIGLESGSEKTNEEIYRRNFDPKLFKEKLTHLYEMNISVILDIIAENPFESYKERCKTARFLAELLKEVYKDRERRRFINVLEHKLMFYPGTELFNKARSNDYIADTYIENVLCKRTSHSYGKEKYRDLDAASLMVTIFNYSWLPIPAFSILKLLSLPRFYGFMDSRLGRFFLKFLYWLIYPPLKLARILLKCEE